MCETLPMKPLVYYHFLDLSSDVDASLAASFEVLGQLMKLPPLQAECPIGRLPEGVVPPILECLLHRDFNEWSGAVLDTLMDQVGTLATDDPNRGIVPRLIVCCAQEHPVAQKCLRNEPNALWGLANVPLAVAYKLDHPPAVWHELLHLVGADDCYEITSGQITDRGPTCEHPHCIMQYAAPERVVDGHLPLCEANARRIAELVAKIKG